ncbi:MAG TPA: hypothetical protein VN089_15565 [Duganella sp.]|nr:hypothetical protein [Duganella sp.]
MTLLRTFIVWLLLLALPYQGYASAAMMLCAPVAPAATHMVMPAGAHDHAAMMAMQDQKPQASADKAGHAHGGIKCGGAAACCVASAPFMAQALAVPMLPVASAAIPFYSEVLRAVDLAHPERPPQGNFV